MHSLLKRHRISFRHAFDGILWAMKTQPNFRVHLGISLIVLICARIFAVTSVELLILLFTIILGLASEMINTALESMTDLITKEYRMEAKIAKDVAAGMMLVVSMGASLIGLIIFIPYIQAFLRG